MAVKHHITLLAMALLATASTLCHANGELYCYWVGFKDKDKANNEYSIKRPHEFLSIKALERRQKFGIAIDSTDLPVSEAYVKKLESMNFKVTTRSRWMNGVTVVAEEDNADKLKALDFVKEVEVTKHFTPENETFGWNSEYRFPTYEVDDTNDGYGNSYPQISMVNGDWLHESGYTGRGVTIAVIDGGFYNVDDIYAYSHVWNNGRVLGVHDIIPGRPDVFNGNIHGGQVLSVMAGYDYGRFIGSATDASYWLIRAEDDRYEAPVEMDNYVAAMEYADSVGVDMVTASLGYTTFSEGSEPIDTTMMDGKHYRASRANTMALKKGIVVVNSVGNKGARPWRKTTVPADAQGVLVVGAVDTDGKRALFSSYGTTADGRICPSVCALGVHTAVLNASGEPSYNSGTSLATPIVSGLAACLMQAFPNAKPNEIIEAIKQTASHASAPDIETGYGVANFQAAYLMLKEMGK